MSEASGGLGRPRNPMSEASEGLEPRRVRPQRPCNIAYTCLQKLPVCASPNLGSRNLNNSGFACVGLPCARFSHVDQIAHFHKKAACGGRGSQFSALNPCLWAPSKKREIEPKNRRIRGPKIGAARRTQFWGRGFTTPVFSSKLYCRNSGPISRPHFWGRETAPFFGPEFAPVQPALVGCAPALVPVTLGSVVVSARGGWSEAAACASL